MTLDQFRVFVAVAEREHMTRAAEALNLTQSAVSATIAAIEARHDVRLFDRVGRRIVLTEAGRGFLAEARAVLHRAAAAEQALSDYAKLGRGRLALVASQTIASYWLPRFLAAFAGRYPGIAIELAIGNTAQAATQVHDGAAELGFVEGPVDDPALARWTIGHDSLVLVRSIAPDRPIDTAWLRDARWIMREPGSGTRAMLESALINAGLDPAALDIALVLPSNEAVRTAVEAGEGVTALSMLVVAPALRLGALAALDFALPKRAFYALRHKERYRSKAADALLDIIRDRAT
jgi:DNA-binding transcriptional LysR family regulator